MLKNYFKIAIAVLRRRKFFTFISLFGISFTLTILLVLTAFIDKVVGDNYPDKKRDRSLYINRVEEKGKNSNNSSQPSYYFLTHFAGAMKTPVKMTVFSGFSGTNTYINNKKIAVDYKYTDANYWDVLEYDFLEGKPFNQQQVANAERVAVISEDMKKQYFGDMPLVTGKFIEADNVKYRVIGVVKNIPITSYMTYSEIYLPYTVAKTDYKGKGYMSNFNAILLGATAADVPKMKAEYEQIVSRIPVEDKKQFDHLYSHANSYISSYVDTGNESQNGVTLVLTVIGVFTFIFMSLPTLNLVNINITRIMERSSEIGVRKAFGASSKTLVYQFIVENIILTLLGGIIGLVLSFVAIEVINSASFIPNLELSINFTVLSIGLLVCLIFGLLSGVYPAWRMSKLKVVTALRAQ
jgi:putative ABC transport system permease protein